MDQDSLLLTNERVLERIRNPSPPAVDIFEPISIVLCKNVPRNVHFSENCVAILEITFGTYFSSGMSKPRY